MPRRTECAIELSKRRRTEMHWGSQHALTESDDSARSCKLPCAASLAAAILFATLTLGSDAMAQVGSVQHVHDPCIIREGKYFYVYSTGPGILVRRSTDLYQWESLGRVLDPEPEWAKNRVKELKGLWAPDIARFGDRFYLFYSVSTFGTNDSSIGVASSKTLDRDAPDYGWTDHGELIRSSPGQADWNAIDPQFVLDEQMQPCLVFGSFLSGIKLTRLAGGVTTPLPSSVQLLKCWPVAENQACWIFSRPVPS